MGLSLLCPVLEVGNINYSQAGAIGGAAGSSILIVAGFRGTYAQPIAERFFVRGLLEVGGVLKPFVLADYAGRSVSTPSRVSFASGIGFGGSL